MPTSTRAMAAKRVAITKVSRIHVGTASSPLRRSCANLTRVSPASQSSSISPTSTTNATTSRSRSDGDRSIGLPGAASMTVRHGVVERTQALSRHVVFHRVSNWPFPQEVRHAGSAQSQHRTAERAVGPPEDGRQRRAQAHGAGKPWPPHHAGARHRSPRRADPSGRVLRHARPRARPGGRRRPGPPSARRW